MSCVDCNNTPCIDCDQSPLLNQTYCTDGCEQVVDTSCVNYDGDVIALGNIAIRPGDNMNKVIKELLRVNYDVPLDITFNPDTRSLCLLKNGITVRCVNIADSDNQYLKVSGNKIQIWRPVGNPNLTTDDVMINEVDLTALLATGTTSIGSRSLSVTNNAPQAPNQFAVELVPSTDSGNSLVLGSDGKPFVPSLSRGVTNVIVNPATCFTFNRDVNPNGTITFTQVVDWACVAAQICPLCTTNVCTPPSNLTVNNV